jgi:hypothetical protein
MLSVLSLLLLLLGLVGVWTGGRRLLAGRLVAATARGFGGLGALALGAVSLGISVNLWTYRSLTWEEPVATVSVQGIGPHEYLVGLREPDAPAREFRLAGDEWQLDARVIKWEPVLALVGQTPLYRLERLSGRYRDIDQERMAERTVHDLAERRGVDLWTLAQNDWLPWIDAYYGSAVFVPLADGAEYQVSLASSGLVVRPANDRAAETVSGWR